MPAEVLTWNVQGRVRGVAEQAAALAARGADVVALQEIRLTALPAWRAELERTGYAHVVSTFDDVPPGTRLPADRRLGVLVAGRDPVERLPAPDVPWPERVLAAGVVLDGRATELLCVHAPLSSRPDQVKVRTLEAVHARLAAPADHPQILAGDLNTPRYETRDGETISFARTQSGRMRPEYGERHDAAELSVLVGLREHGWRDAFRTTHGYGARDRSWTYPSGRGGWRLDHLLVRGLEIETCAYEHAWREARLSDHSGLWARLRAPRV